MIRVTKQGSEASEAGSTNAHHYRSAGHRMIFQQPVKALSAYAEGQASASFSEVMARPMDVRVLDQGNAELGYIGNAQFENKMQEVKCWKDEHIRQVDVAGTPVCRVDLQGNHIHLLNEGSFDERLNLEVVTGPALILLLAREKTYCLHAGAVATPYGNIAFIAESGTGKSTLSEHQDEQWQQISDDILPLAWQQDITMLPDYPQLKLNNAVVPEPLRGPAPVDLIIRLSNEHEDQPMFRRLARTDALLQIVRHTVAAKLFDNEQLRSHARFAKHLSGEVAMVELRYPRELSKLPALRRSIIGYLQLGQFD